MPTTTAPPETTIRRGPTLAADLERRRLAVRERRLDHVVRALRVERRVRPSAGERRPGLERALDDMTRQLDETRARLAQIRASATSRPTTPT